jgi:hypothetical protein
MKKLLVFVCMLGLTAGLASASLLELEVTDGTNTALINSSGSLVITGSASGVAVTSTPGVYTFDGTVGNYNVNVSTGVASPVLDVGELDLNSENTASGSNSGPLEIWFSVNGITELFGGWELDWGGTITGKTSDSVTYEAYQSNLNAFFGTTNLIGTIGPESPTKANVPFAFSGTTSGGVAGVTSGYSLTQEIIINGSGKTSYSGDASLTPVPEPASIVLVGAGLLALCKLRRRTVKP